MSESADPFGKSTKKAIFDPDAPLTKTSAAAAMLSEFPPDAEPTTTSNDSSSTASDQNTNTDNTNQQTSTTTATAKPKRAPFMSARAKAAAAAAAASTNGDDAAAKEDGVMASTEEDGAATKKEEKPKPARTKFMKPTRPVAAAAPMDDDVMIAVPKSRPQPAAVSGGDDEISIAVPKSRPPHAAAAAAESSSSSVPPASTSPPLPSAAAASSSSADDQPIRSSKPATPALDSSTPAEEDSVVLAPRPKLRGTAKAIVPVSDDDPFGAGAKKKVFDPDAPLAKTSAASMMSEYPPGYDPAADGANGGDQPLNDDTVAPLKPKPMLKRKPVAKKPPTAKPAAKDDEDKTKSEDVAASAASSSSSPSVADELPIASSSSSSSSASMNSPPAKMASSSAPSMSEFPDDEQGGGEAEVFTGPLESRLVHKNWKARQQAYEEMKNELSAVADDDEDARREAADKYAGFLKKMVNDVSVPALEAGLQAAAVWVDKASYDHGAPTHAEDLMAACLKKGYGGRPGTKAASDTITLLLVECGAADIVLATLVTGAQGSVPKIAAACASLLVQALTQFGPGVIAFDKLRAALPKILAHTNNMVRKEAMDLACELYRWMGAIFTNHLKTMALKSSQQTELDGLFEKVVQGQARPTKFVRSEAAKQAVAGGKKGKAGAASAEGAAFDPMSLIKPVDIGAKLSKGWCDKVLGEKKWQDRAERLKELLTLSDATPKIEMSGALIDAIGSLKKCLKDSQIMIQGDALKCILSLAKGTRRAFYPYAKQLYPIMIQLLKEKKVNVAIPLQQCFDTFAEFGIIELSEALEFITEGLADKVSKVRQDLSEYLQRCLASPRVTDKMLKDVMKPLGDALFKVMNDPDVAVRNAGTAAMAELVATVGKQRMADLLRKCEGMDGNRYQKLDQLITASKKNGTASASSSSSSSSSSAPAAEAEEEAVPEPATKKPAAKRPASAAVKKAPPAEPEPEKKPEPAARPASAAVTKKPVATAAGKLGKPALVAKTAAPAAVAKVQTGTKQPAAKPVAAAPVPVAAVEPVPDAKATPSKKPVVARGGVVQGRASQPIASPPRQAPVGSKSAQVSPRSSFSSNAASLLPQPAPGQRSRPASPPRAVSAISRLPHAGATGGALTTRSSLPVTHGASALPDCFSLDLDGPSQPSAAGSSLSTASLQYSQTAPSSPRGAAAAARVANSGPSHIGTSHATTSSISHTSSLTHNASTLSHTNRSSGLISGLTSGMQSGLTSRPTGLVARPTFASSSNDQAMITQLKQFMETSSSSHASSDERMAVMKELWQMIQVHSAILITAGLSDEFVVFLMRHVESCFVEDGAGALTINHRLCRYALNTLLEVFKVVAVAKCVKMSTLDELIRMLLLLLMDDRLKTHPDESCRTLTMAVNVLVLKVLENSDRTSIFQILLLCLRNGAGRTLDVAHSKTFGDLVIRSLMKLSKNLLTPGYVAGIHLPTLLKAIHDFMITHATATADDLPLKAVKAILSNLANLPDVDIREYTSTLPRNSPTLVFIEKMLQYNNKQKTGATPQSVKKPEIAVSTSRVQPSDQVARRLDMEEAEPTSASSARSNHTPAASPSPANSTSSDPSSDPIQLHLAEIVARTIKPATTQAALKELHEFTLEYPHIDIWPAFRQQGDSFRAYVQRSLDRLKTVPSDKPTPLATPISTPIATPISSPTSTTFAGASANPSATTSTTTSSAAALNSTTLYRQRLSALQDRAKVATAVQASAPAATSTLPSARSSAGASSATMDAIRARWKSNQVENGNASSTPAASPTPAPAPTAESSHAPSSSPQPVAVTQTSTIAAPQPVATTTTASKSASSIEAIKARIAAMNKAPQA